MKRKILLSLLALSLILSGCTKDINEPFMESLETEKNDKNNDKQVIEYKDMRIKVPGDWTPKDDIEDFTTYKISDSTALMITSIEDMAHNRSFTECCNLLATEFEMKKRDYYIYGSSEKLKGKMTMDNIYYSVCILKNNDDIYVLLIGDIYNYDDASFYMNSVIGDVYFE